MNSQSEDVEFNELLNDPTLADCCRRDLLEARENEQITDALSQVDRSTQGVNLHQHVFSNLGGSVLASSSKEDLEPGSDGDELQHLRQQRLQQLQQQDKSQQQRARGDIETLPASKLLSYVEDKDGPVVCHLYVDGHEPCSVLDEYLSVLAHRYSGTHFVRVQARAATQIRQVLQGQMWSGLVCFRNASIVGRSRIEQLGGASDVFEEEVGRYLHRLRVLLHGKQTSAQDECYSDDEAEEEQDDRYPPCETCGRTYPHEHIRSVTRSAAFEDDEDSDDLGD